MFAALLDTCVLWPSLQRDFSLSLAIEGLFRPLWSSAILDELRYHEAAKLRRRLEANPEERADWLVEQMTLHFADAIVVGWEQLTPYGLPDPDDEHVLAAAVVGGAGAVVTENQKDFPATIVPSHIEVVSAAAFARDAVSVDPGRAVAALEEMSRRREDESPAEILDVLAQRYGMHEATELVREVL